MNATKTVKSISLKRQLGVCLLLSTTALVSACGSDSTQLEKPVITQLNELVSQQNNKKNDKQPSKCDDKLLEVGNQLINKKTHFLQLVQPIVVATDNTDTDKKNKTVYTEQSPTANHYSISGVLNYNDRPSHVRFDVNLNEDDKGQQFCVISYQLDYQLDTPCVAVREEVFKKWLPVSTQGQLGNNTSSYVHKRKLSQKAYLTNINRNVQCLVSVRNDQSFLVE